MPAGKSKLGQFGSIPTAGWPPNNGVPYVLVLVVTVRPWLSTSVLVDSSGVTPAGKSKRGHSGLLLGNALPKLGQLLPNEVNVGRLFLVLGKYSQSVCGFVATVGGSGVVLVVVDTTKGSAAPSSASICWPSAVREYLVWTSWPCALGLLTITGCLLFHSSFRNSRCNPIWSACWVNSTLGVLFSVVALPSCGEIMTERENNM